VMTVLFVAAAALAWVAYGARNRAIEAQKQAERRYDQALNTTLRLVTTTATFSSVIGNEPFQSMQIQAKGDSDDFHEFLNGAPDPDEIWFRLVQVLIAYEKRLPPELQRIRPRLEAMSMRKQWLEHADLILRNRENRLSQRSDYARVRADLDTELARVSTADGSP